MAESAASTSLRYASDPDPNVAATRTRTLDLPPPNRDLPLEKRGGEVLRLAQEAFAQTGDWVLFYRTLLGADGVVRQLFPAAEERGVFEGSREFAELQEMLAAMRSEDATRADATEPERMITIRLPKSLHDVLKLESEECNLSINKLCISKLLQPIESRFTPIQQGRRRGRKPGPQGPRKGPGNEASQD